MASSPARRPGHSLRLFGARLLLSLFVVMPRPAACQSDLASQGPSEYLAQTNAGQVATTNPEYEVRVVVNTMARWVEHPTQPNLPPYFAAELGTVNIRVEFTSNNRKQKLADDIQSEVLKRLKSIQASSQSRPPTEWIIVPGGARRESFAGANLLEDLLTYAGQSLVISTLPPPRTNENLAPLPPLRTNPITLYEVRMITITVNKPALNAGMPVTFRLENLWGGMPKGSPERQISVEVYQSDSVCKHPDRVETAKRTASVVARLYERLYGVGLKIDSFSPFPQTPYDEPISNWTKSFALSPAGVRWMPATGELRISGLPVVHDVVLDPSGSEANFGRLWERLKARACSELVGFPLTDEGKSSFEYLGEQDPAVKTAVATDETGVLKLRITPRPTFGHLTGSAGPAYSNQTGWTGKASVTGQDLIRSQRFYDLTNTTQLSYQGGGSFQDADAHVSVAKPSRDPFPRLEFYSLAVGCSFTQNQNDRFGGFLPGQTLTVSETQGTAGLKLAYDSFSIFDESEAANSTPAGRKLNRHQIVMPFSFAFDRFLATSNHSTYRSSGNVFQFSVSPVYTYTHDFDSLGKKRGWSSLVIDGTAEYIKGKDTSTSAAFDRYLGSIRITAKAGWLSTRQFLFRGEYGVGSLSAGGPIVRTFQLGGTQWVPGLQFGEDSGQTIGFAQSEIGIDLASIVKLFGHDVPPNTKLFDMRSSYLKMVYSRASVSQRESVSAVASLNSGVESFGPAVELGGLNHMFDLTAGYMYSPQSALHVHGTSYLTVRFSDFRMR